METKPSIFLTNKKTLTEQLKTWGFPKFRAAQICDWLFNKKALRVEQFANLPKNLKDKLQEEYSWDLPKVVSRIEGKDGSTKLLIKGEKDQLFETVILRYENRISLCLSSQVGCKRACNFCQTGKLGFFRNLKAYEIVAQYLLAQEIVAAEGKNISHMVFMGMGEPFDNFKEVSQALKIFTSEESHHMSPRRITVSTVGIPEKIIELAQTVPTRLALSLHVACDEERTKLMPINRRYPS